MVILYREHCLLNAKVVILLEMAKFLGILLCRMLSLSERDRGFHERREQVVMNELYHL